VGNQGIDRRGIAVLAGAHALADTCQGAVPALLPFLVAQRHYSLTAASALVLAAAVTSSIIQPAFGFFADRRSLSWLMPAGLLVAVTGIGLAGLIVLFHLAPKGLTTVLGVVVGAATVATFSVSRS